MSYPKSDSTQPYTFAQSVRDACDEVITGSRPTSLVTLPSLTATAPAVRARVSAAQSGVNVNLVRFRVVSTHVVAVSPGIDINGRLDAVNDAVMFLDRNPDATVTVQLDKELEPYVNHMLSERSGTFEFIRVGSDRYGLRKLTAEQSSTLKAVA